MPTSSKPRGRSSSARQRSGCDASLDAALDALDGGPLSPAERRDVTINDRALLIYTSGTTGLPKAASISHRRILNWGGWFAGLTDATPDDRLYDCLPVYHSVGGIVAPCSMLFAGASVVLAEKFSATNFWQRCRPLRLHAVPVYRRALPLSPEGAGIRIRNASTGCGLPAATACAATSGKQFQARFAIPRILEFYAATEGNFSLYNVEGKVGAIGRIPPLLAHRFPAAIVKVDAEHGAPLRDDDGLCIACARGEIGEAIGRIGTADEGGGRFEGYTDAPRPKRKSCATSSPRATPGSAPAI